MTNSWGKCGANILVINAFNDIEDCITKLQNEVGTMEVQGVI